MIAIIQENSNVIVYITILHNLICIPLTISFYTREFRGRRKFTDIRGRHSYENARQFVRKKKKDRNIYFETAYGPAALSKFILTGKIVKRSFYETDNRRAPTFVRSERLKRGGTVQRRIWKDERGNKIGSTILKPRAI